MRARPLWLSTIEPYSRPHPHRHEAPLHRPPKQLPHNTNASQVWLAAHLPLEPPEVSPASISGPVLVTADNIR